MKHRFGLGISCVELWRGIVAAAILGAVLSAQGVDERRHIALTGAPNFRDIGGYRTADGRTVRWGQVYRSGQLSALTDIDYERLVQLGISVICDLRDDDERRDAPTHWKGAQTLAISSLPNPPPLFLQTPNEMFANGGTAAEMRAHAHEVYQLVVDYAPSFRLTLGKS
jgi:protein-tyrosine phosphatase